MKAASAIRKKMIKKKNIRIAMMVRLKKPYHQGKQMGLPLHEVYYRLQDAQMSGQPKPMTLKLISHVKDFEMEAHLSRNGRQ